MAGQVVPMQFGGVKVLVETVPVAGNERTSMMDKAADQVSDVAARVRATVAAVAESMAGLVDDLAGSRVARPDSVEVELGLGFSAKGQAIVVSGEASASVKITLTYNRTVTLPGQAE